jgi:hypothetical protein
MLDQILVEFDEGVEEGQGEEDDLKDYYANLAGQAEDTSASSIPEPPSESVVVIPQKRDYESSSEDEEDDFEEV